MTINYEKAVRDKIPEIIEKSGKKCVVKKLTDDDYLPELEKKLSEELDEYYSSKTIEELADIVEIIYRILELRAIDGEEFEQIRLVKNQTRGGFCNNFYLIEVQED